MAGKLLVCGMLAAVLISMTGCCRWCERHCQQPATCCPTYAAAPVCCPPPAAACCPAPAPACCPAPAQYAPQTQYAPQAQYAPPQQGWQRSFSSPQNCSCQ